MLQTPSVGKIIYLLVLIILISFSLEAQIVNSFVDIRDGQTYKTVTYAVTSSKQVITDHDEYGAYLNGEPRTFEVSFKNGVPGSMTWMAQNLNFEKEGSKCKSDSDTNCKSYGSCILGKLPKVPVLVAGIFLRTRSGIYWLICMTVFLLRVNT